MNNCQFKFKPDKIKYLSNIDTLDSTHKKTIENINKKHEDIPKKIKRLEKLKNDLIQIDLDNSITPNYSSIRTKIIDDINMVYTDIENTVHYDGDMDKKTSINTVETPKTSNKEININQKNTINNDSSSDNNG